MDRYGGGDDLEDDFVFDDIVAFSDEEGGHSADADDVNALLSAEEDPVEDAEALRAGWRK